MEVPPPQASAPPPAAPSSDASDRLDLRYLDGLRALAAIAVVLRHGWLSIWLGGADTAPHWVPFLLNGHTVPVFVVLSGYCLMLPVVRGDGTLRGGLAAFYVKRARRILPPYYFAIAFALMLDFLFIGNAAGGFWAGTMPLTWHGLLVHLLMLQNFSVSQIHTFNYVLWSLSLEWWFYLLFPALVVAWKRLGPGVTTAAIFAASALASGACRHALYNGFSLHFGVLFALGMLGAELAYTRRAALSALRDRLPWGGLTCLAAGLLLLSLTGHIRHFSSNEMADLLVGLFAVSLLVTLATRPGTPARRVLSCRPLVFVGMFAYSIYLVHAPLVQILWQFVAVPLHLAPLISFLLLAAFGLPAILAASYMFYLLCERPFVSRLRPGAAPAAASPRQILLGPLGNCPAFRDVPLMTRIAGGAQISQAAEKEVFYERSGLGFYRRIR